MKKELIAHEDPKSHVSELFRTLRTNVQFMNSNKKLRTLLVTSTLPGEGKTWISSNLAIAFAQADKRVILIDADMRKCCLHNIFKVSPCPGLSNYLAGVNENSNEIQNLDNYIRETEVPNLYLIPAGNVPPNPSELLTTPQMATLLERLKEICDLIIIDGTPSKLVTDAIILSRIVDSTIIVTGHNMAKKEDLSKIVRDIKNVGGKIAGVVYNQKPDSKKKKNETYYYASTPMKIDSKKKLQEMEYEHRRQVQRNRATDMLNRDRNPEEYQKNAADQTRENGTNIEYTANAENKTDIIETTSSNIPIKEETPVEKTQLGTEMPPEQRAAEMLKQFNDYLQKEKENRDNNRS